MARMNRSEFSAHAALAASRGASAARKVQTLRDLLARLPFLFAVAVAAFVAVAVVAVSIV